jgi:hypothetical protein
MLSDLERTYSNLQENMKQAVVPHDIAVGRGSKIEFLSTGKLGIVYNSPNDDLVSTSLRILICNTKVSVMEFNEIYDDDNGDITFSGYVEKATLDGFIERLSAQEKQYDVGLLHEAILRFVTYVDTDITLEDRVQFKAKQYRVVDIDEITEGLRVIQLAYERV